MNEDPILVEGGKPVDIPNAKPQEIDTLKPRLAVDKDGNHLATAGEHHHHFKMIVIAVIATFIFNAGIFLTYNEYVVKPAQVAAQVRQAEILAAAETAQKQAQALIDVLTSKSRTLQTAVAKELTSMGFKAKP